jgi:hypothetical protein
MHFDESLQPFSFDEVVDNFLSHDFEVAPFSGLCYLSFHGGNIDLGLSIPYHVSSYLGSR